MSRKTEAAAETAQGGESLMDQLATSAVGLVDVKHIFDPDVILGFVTLHGMKLLVAVAIFFIGKWIAKHLTRLVSKAMMRARIDPTLIGFLTNIVYGVVLMFVAVAALAHMGIETTSLAALIGAAGLAIGLALQGSLSNFAAGVLIVFFRFFKVGDYVVVGGQGGTVVDISILTTQLNTPDNVRVVMPNNKITSDVILNYTANDTRRLELVIGVAYDADLKMAQQVLYAVLVSDERVLQDPSPVVEVLTLNESSVDFAVRPWVTKGDYWDLHFGLLMKIKIALDEAGIGIPFPQRDIYVHLKDAKALAGKVIDKKEE